MSRATFQWKGEEWARGVLPVAIADGLNAAAASLTGLAKRNVRSAVGPSAPGAFPHASRKSELRRGFAYSKATPTRFLARAGNTAKHAKIIELGSEVMGYIKPKTKRMLTIPLNEEAKKMRGQYPDLEKLKGRIFQSKKGPPVLVIGKGQRTKTGGEAAFLLVPKVWIAARPYLRPALEKNRPRLIEAVRRGMRARINGSLTGGVA